MKLEDINKLRKRLRELYKEDPEMNRWLVNRDSRSFELILEARLETFLRHGLPEELEELKK